MNLVELSGFGTKRRMLWYAVVAYGLPLVVVGVAAAVDSSNYSGRTVGKPVPSIIGFGKTRDFCWIGAGNFALIAFVGPIGVLLIVSCEPTSPPKKNILQIRIYFKRGQSWDRTTGQDFK
jgi:hypothetical protein